MENNIDQEQYIEDIFKIIEKLYVDDEDLIGCIEYVKQIENKILSGDVISRDNKDEDLTDYEYFKSNLTVRRVCDDGDLLYKCWESYKYLQTNKPDHNSDGIERWFKYEEDNNMVTICGRTILNADIMTVLACLSEFDRKPIEAVELDKQEEFSSFRWLLKIRIKMPTTFSDREVYAFGLGSQLPNTKCVILPFKSVTDGFYGLKLPPEDSEVKRVVVNYGFILMKYIDEDYTEITNCYNIDPKIPLIPSFLLNSFIKPFAYYIIRDLKKTIENTDSEVYRRIIQEEKKEFYDKIWSRLKPNIEN